MKTSRHLGPSSRTAGALLLVAACLAVTACGTATVGDASGVEQALASGSPAGLTTADQAGLLARAIKLSEQLTAHGEQLLGCLYVEGGKPLDLSLHYTSDSVAILPQARTLATPFLVADTDRRGMAVIAEIGRGRALAYGADVLGWMSGTTTEQQHFPLFARAFRWAVTGSPDGTLPPVINFVAPSYQAAKVKALAVRLGVQAQGWPTKLSDGVDAFKTIDLIVLDPNMADDPDLTAQVRALVEAGKPVIFMQPHWYLNDVGPKILAALDMRYDGYNYWYGQGVTIPPARTLADSIERGVSFRALTTSLKALADDRFTADLAADTSFTDAISLVHGDLQAFHARRVKVFEAPGLELYRLLVLWADLYRPGIVYGAIDKAVLPATFLRTYASDSWTVYNRRATTTARAGQGDYMPAAAQALPVSGDWEELDVTIAQSGGTTLIGRGALPARAVQVQVVDTAGATGLSIQTSHIRTAGNPLSDEDYPRPRRPHSFAVPLSLAAGETTDFVSPFGGPLMLGYSGATGGTVVKLRVRGAARYAHFDYSDPAAPMSQADFDAAVAALGRGDFGWQTAKFVGGELQQISSYARSKIGAGSPADYVADVKDYIFDTNHRANGYNDMPLSADQVQRCGELGWDCAGDAHRAPGVQHFVGWIATCGFLCSGNPSDGSTGIDLGWGWTHELGHNTVQRVMTIAPDGKGCTGECNNNILASAQMIRLWADGRSDGKHAGWNYNHIQLYGLISASRATGLSGEPLRADLQSRLWDMANSNAMQAVHAQLAFLYGKHRLGLARPTPDSLLSFYGLLTKGDRLVGKAWTVADAARYGMGRYTSNSITNHDLLYVLSSKIIGRDLRGHFLMVGLPLSATALDSVADLGLPAAPLDFYAQPKDGCNRLEIGQWVTLPSSGALPAYPYP